MTSFAHLSSSFCRRFSSSSISIKPSSGMNSSAPDTTADIDFSGASIWSPIVKVSGLQKRSIYAAFSSSTDNVVSSFALIVIGTFLLIGVCTSARIVRTERMTSINSFMLSAFLLSLSSAFTAGQAAIVIDSPSVGRFCQISSVMNGMNGCSKRIVLSSTYASTERVIAFACSSSPYNGNFAISMYQSQKSSQIKL